MPAETARDLADDLPVDAGLARRVGGPVVLDDAALAVRRHALVFRPHGTGEDDVRPRRCLGEEEIDLHVELERLVHGVHDARLPVERQGTRHGWRVLVVAAALGKLVVGRRCSARCLDR